MYIDGSNTCGCRQRCGACLDFCWGCRAQRFLTLRCVFCLYLVLLYLVSQVPLHTVIQLSLSRGRVVGVQHHRLAVDCVDTHRAKPTNCHPGRGALEACHTVPQHL